MLSLFSMSFVTLPIAMVLPDILSARNIALPPILSRCGPTLVTKREPPQHTIVVELFDTDGRRRLDKR